MMRKQRLAGKRKDIFQITSAGILGAGLLAGWLVTGKNGLSGQDRQIYEQAVSMQEQVDTLGFGNFRLQDYPVAMYDGTKDYVFYQGEIKERAPVLETFAGTVYPVEDHFEVIIPTVEQFDKLLSLAGGVEGMVTGSGYGPREQKAVLWHEAFHAYQLTHFAILGEKVTAEEMEAELEADQAQEGISEEAWIVREVDQKDGIRKKIEAELHLLESAAKLSSQMDKENGRYAADMGKLKEILSRYGESRRQRLAEMPQEAVEAEIRCELTEGPAYYMEAKVYEMLSGKDAYEEQYLDGISVFEGGRGKYYRTGMAKCLILDQILPDWKNTFDFTMGLDECCEQAADPPARLHGSQLHTSGLAFVLLFTGPFSWKKLKIYM